MALSAAVPRPALHVALVGANVAACYIGARCLVGANYDDLQRESVDGPLDAVFGLIHDHAARRRGLAVVHCFTQ
jgi:hypothetical protein